MGPIIDQGTHSNGSNTEQKNGEEFHEKSISTTLSIDKMEKETEIRVYNERFLMLFIVFVLNMANGALWISFSTVVNSTADYFNVTNSQVDWFSLIFCVVSVPTMFFALWFTDIYGFKPTIVVGSFLNAIGSLIRLISTVPGINDPVRYPLALTGQAVIALSQPFAVSLHTKISQVWFADHQRTRSTAVAAMANPFGFMVGSIVFPVIVVDKDKIPMANYVLCGLGIAVGIFPFLVRHSRPPTPPSVTAADKIIRDKSMSLQAYARELYQLARNKDFVVLCLAIGGGMGMISTLNMMMAQILCPEGYNNKIAGLCSGAMVVLGYVGGAVSTLVSEKTKFSLEEIAKFGYSISVVASIIATLVIRTNNQIAWAIALMFGVFGFFSMGTYPVSLEAGVETTYPLDESYSAGLIVVFGQIQGIIFIPVMEVLAQHIDADDKAREVCSEGSATEAYDMTYSGIFMTSYAVVLNILFVLFFKPKYRRREAETRKQPLVSVTQ